MRWMNCFPCDIYTIRVYDHPLTEGERNRNHTADLFAYYGLDTELFALMPKFKPGQFVEFRYEDFVKSPEDTLRLMYRKLDLDGYEEALPAFREYIEGQKNYVKNKFTISPRLREKIERELGFYFEHYGYCVCLRRHL